MSLDRVWILSSQALKLTHKQADICHKPTVPALLESLDPYERVILLAPLDELALLETALGNKILAARSIPKDCAAELLPSYIEGVLKDSQLNRELEALENSAWTGGHQSDFDEPAMELLGRTVLEISSCREISELEKILQQACARLAPLQELRIAHDPPFLSSRVLAQYQLAIPVNFNLALKAHVYARFAEASENQVESVGEFLLNLSDIVALAVERSRLLSQAEHTRLVWESSFNAVEDPLVILDENLQIVRANKAYGILLGISVPKLAGKPVDPALRVQEGPSENQEWDIQFKDQWYRVYLDPIRSPLGAGKSVLRLRNTSSERILTEKILAREQVAEMGILISSVAHEINNPIGGIIALGQLLNKDLPTDDTLKADLQNILEAAERCKRIVQTMLSLVRKADDKKLALHLGESLAAALGLVSSEVQRLGVRVEAGGLDEGAAFYGNRNRIMQVFFHILQGALQALEERKQQEGFSAQMILSINATDGGWDIDCRDNGLRKTHEHGLKNSVSYAVTEILLEEHQRRLQLWQDGQWNFQKISLPAISEETA